MAEQRREFARPVEVLIVSGEASGDRIAAGVARSLATRDVRAWGMGGAASLAAGIDLEADLRHSTAMGITGVARRLPSVVRAFARLARRAQQRPPCAAVLIDYTEFNLRLARWLGRFDVPILWCVAPQVWAWRPNRTCNMARTIDRMATILPFETAIWRRAGVDTHYVGHPALDTPPLPRETARATLRLAQASPSVALLPGSRSHEVRLHTDVMLTSVCNLRRSGVAIDARLAIAASLDRATRAWLASRAAASNVATFDAHPERGAAPWLTAFDASLAVSGTVTLESALAGAPPVILYRTSQLTRALARRLLKTPFIGLPNVVLGAPAYPEIVYDVTPEAIARALLAVLARLPAFATTATTLRAKFDVATGGARPIGNSCGERAASLLDDWLDLARSRERRARHRTGHTESRASAPSGTST